VSPNDIAPPTDWNAINAEISRREENHLDTVEVPARLLLLSGNVAVYVDVTTDAKSQVIEFNGAGADRIERVPTNEIRQGMYILLRTGGGGDLVAPVADKILGERAQDVRFIQKQWKSALSTLVRDEGEDVVLRNLRELGCKRASHLNLRNWINDRNIRPEFDDDFLSILILCGLDDEDELYVSNARLLDRVHRRAGFQIRRMLLDKVGKADLGCLVSEGSMEFELSGEAGGSFTAYRIEEISPETFPTSVTRLNQLFDAETGYG
jgi:hypothetical protein